jgi:L-alanine-DL-glutamate epimerase-like enolase superfamily enzyme
MFGMKKTIPEQEVALPRSLNITAEHWPLARPFRISRGVRTEAVVITVAIGEGEHVGRGECVPYAHYGETVESVMAQIYAVGQAVRDGVTRDELRAIVTAGAARNALDCALWDLEAQSRGFEAMALLAAPLPPIHTAYTVSLDSTDRMAAAARDLAGIQLVKVKLDGEDVEARLRAVRGELPDARLIVDANEAWTMALLEQIQPVLVELHIDFVEQPLPASEDAVLAGFSPLVPICADESCHVAADVEILSKRYGLVNIKLDKTGGLTEALDLLAAARARGMGVMLGCMMCTSLSIAPALRVAAQADYVDVDGPFWLASDRPGGIALGEGGLVVPPSHGFWGSVIEV